MRNTEERPTDIPNPPKVAQPSFKETVIEVFGFFHTELGVDKP